MKQWFAAFFALLLAIAVFALAVTLLALACQWSPGAGIALALVMLAALFATIVTQC